MPSSRGSSVASPSLVRQRHLGIVRLRHGAHSSAGSFDDRLEFHRWSRFDSSARISRRPRHKVRCRLRRPRAHRPAGPSASSRPSTAITSNRPGEVVDPVRAARSGWATWPSFTSDASRMLRARPLRGPARSKPATASSAGRRSSKRARAAASSSLHRLLAQRQRPHCNIELSTCSKIDQGGRARFQPGHRRRPGARAPHRRSRSLRPPAAARSARPGRPSSIWRR